jgi:hypothetical protein
MDRTKQEHTSSANPSNQAQIQPRRAVTPGLWRRSDMQAHAAGGRVPKRILSRILPADLDTWPAGFDFGQTRGSGRAAAQNLRAAADWPGC